MVLRSIRTECDQYGRHQGQMGLGDGGVTEKEAVGGQVLHGALHRLRNS